MTSGCIFCQVFRFLVRSVNWIFKKILILDFITPNSILFRSNIFLEREDPLKNLPGLQPGVKMIWPFYLLSNCEILSCFYGVLRIYELYSIWSICGSMCQSFFQIAYLNHQKVTKKSPKTNRNRQNFCFTFGWKKCTSFLIVDTWNWLFSEWDS